MNLRKECEHGQYDRHRYSPNGDRYFVTCPGGTEPSDDELIAELERRGVVGGHPRMAMNGFDFLDWVADRLVYQLGDPPSADFILRLRRMASPTADADELIHGESLRLDPAYVRHAGDVPWH